MCNIFKGHCAYIMSALHVQTVWAEFVSPF